MNKNLFKVLKTLFIILSTKKELISSLHMFFKTFTRMLRTQGIVHTVKYFKGIRLHVTRYMCGQPLLVNDLMIGVDKSGFPKMISYFKKYFDERDKLSIRLILTVLTITRLFTYPKSKNKPIPLKLETITDPYKGRKYIIPNFFIKRFVQFYDLNTSIPKFDRKNIILSTKAGPSGPATLSIHKYILNLSYTQLHYLSRITDVPGFDWICSIYK